MSEKKDRVFLNPGMRAPKTGIYRNTVSRQLVSVKRGQKLPPTQNRGSRYRYWSAK